MASRLLSDHHHALPARGRTSTSKSVACCYPTYYYYHQLKLYHSWMSLPRLLIPSYFSFYFSYLLFSLALSTFQCISPCFMQHPPCHLGPPPSPESFTYRYAADIPHDSCPPVAQEFECGVMSQCGHHLPSRSSFVV